MDISENTEKAHIFDGASPELKRDKKYWDLKNTVFSNVYDQAHTYACFIRNLYWDLVFSLVEILLHLRKTYCINLKSIKFGKKVFCNLNFYVFIRYSGIKWKVICAPNLSRRSVCYVKLHSSLSFALVLPFVNYNPESHSLWLLCRAGTKTMKAF